MGVGTSGRIHIKCLRRHCQVRFRPCGFPFFTFKFGRVTYFCVTSITVDSIEHNGDQSS